MLLSGGGLKVIHVTTHMSLEEACQTISQQHVYRAIRLAEYSMKLLGIEHPRVGVAGLNPHASENGLFGTQERESIIPAVEQAAAEGIKVSGPVPPDTVFAKPLFVEQSQLAMKDNAFKACALFSTHYNNDC